MILALLALSATAASPIGGIGEPRVPAVRVRLAATSAVFASPREVRLQVTIENAGRDCYPILIDPSFQPVALNRPSLLLQLFLYDERQELVPMAKGFGSDLRGLRPSDLLLLNCGAFYGRYLDLSKPDWTYSLVKGAYRVRARVTCNLGTFMKSRRDLVRAVEGMVGLSPESVGYMLADWHAESDDVTFEVR